jgi:hypothetical protein
VVSAFTMGAATAHTPREYRQLQVDACAGNVCRRALLLLVCGCLAKCTAGEVACTAQERGFAGHTACTDEAINPLHFVCMGWRAGHALLHIMFHVCRELQPSPLHPPKKHRACYHLGLGCRCVIFLGSVAALSICVVTCCCWVAVCCQSTVVNCFLQRPVAADIWCLP